MPPRSGQRCSHPEQQNAAIRAAKYCLRREQYRPRRRLAPEIEVPQDAVFREHRIRHTDSVARLALIPALPFPMLAWAAIVPWQHNIAAGAPERAASYWFS